MWLDKDKAKDEKNKLRHKEEMDLYVKLLKVKEAKNKEIDVKAK